MTNTSLLINPPHERRPGGGVVPPLGLAMLASVLERAGSVPKILDLAALLPDFQLGLTTTHVDLLTSELQANGVPRLLCFGPLVTANLIPLRDLVEAARRFGVPLIAVGGPLCAAPGFHDVFRRYVRADVYVWGDGEEAIHHIWDDPHPEELAVRYDFIGTQDVPARSPARTDDLDSLPLPARTLCNGPYSLSVRRSHDASEQKSTIAFLSRGCPYACTFCAAPLVSGRKLRRLSPARITAELDACAMQGFNDIVFYDDCLFVKGPRLNATIEEFTGAVLRSAWRGTYQMEMRCDAVAAMSDVSLSCLRATGLRQVNLGIEKATAATLLQIRKKLTPEIAQIAVNRLHEVGIRTAGTFILGGLGESRDMMTATIQFAESLPLTFAHFNPLALYPGTALFSSVYGDGADWLELCLDRTTSPWGDMLFASSATPLSVILSEVRRGYQRFYSEERILQQAQKLPSEDASSLKTLYSDLAVPRSLFYVTPDVH